MSPPAGSLDSVATAPGYRRTASGVDDDAVSMIEGGCKARVTVAACCDLRVRPPLETNFFERAAVLLCGATGEKNSRAIELFRQFSKDRAQALGRGQPEIGCGQFAMLKNPKFPRRRVRARDIFYEDPCGLRAAAFDPEDALTGFHDSLCITAFWEI